MSRSSVVGFVLLAVGGVLLFIALRASMAPVEQLSEALTGRYTGDTVWFLLAGVAGVVGGTALIVRDAWRA
jgi:hypothetical protein